MRKIKKSRRVFFVNIGGVIMSASLAPFASLFRGKASAGKDTVAKEIFYTTGFKVMEVGQHEAFIWTRLCSKNKPVPVRHERKKKGVNFYPVDFNESMPVEKMDGAVPGTKGYVRVKLDDGNHESVSAWHFADPEKDHTVAVPIGGLKAGTAYNLILESRLSNESEIYSIEGRFKTAPARDEPAPVHLTTCTCQYFWNYDDRERGFKTYDAIRKLKPDFFIHTGDYVYYDMPGPLAASISHARHQWHAMDSRPAIKELYQTLPVYLLKDDHDLLSDDAYPDSPPLEGFSWEDGLKIWHENVPLKDKPYRTFRWGRDLQIWLAEGREYRSARNVPEGTPRTIWGEEQKIWFQKTVKESNATFKLLFSPTPVVGPDRDTKKDNHANAMFEEEGDWLRDFLASQPGMYVVNGDRHWQYYSIDEETGLKEFGAGPVSDAMAGGWHQDDMRPEHRYLRVKGGFMGINVYREKGQPYISFTHYDVEGQEMHTEHFRAEK